MLTQTEPDNKDKKQEVHAGGSNDTATESCELMILRAMDHVQMAKAQHELYEALVLKTRDNSKENIPHSTQSYTFVVDYGENMDYC